MYHLMTCGDAPNCTWTDLAMPNLAGVNCANTGRNLSNSNYRGLDEEEKSSSLSKAMGMLPPCNFLLAAIIVVIPVVLWVPAILRVLVSH